MNLTASSNLLIPDRLNDDTMRSLIESHVDIVNSSTIEIWTSIQRMMDVDTASGVWLDLLGEKVGIKRLFVVNDGTKRFGFKGVSRAAGFFQEPFNSTEPEGEFIGLADEIFRLLIKARGVLVIGNGTIDDLKRAVEIISPEASVFDNRNMTITIYTEKMELFDLAEQADALPRNAGVKIDYKDRSVFGFKGAGVGFEQGRFRP